MKEQELSLLLLGDIRREEFRLVWENLPVCFQRKAVIRKKIKDILAVNETFLDAENFLENVPEIILLLQSFPGEFTVTEVEQLRRNYPLSRMIVVYGSWCEGEERSGEPLMNTARIHWADWIVRAPEELEAYSRGEVSIFSYPDTLQTRERFLWEAEIAKKRAENKKHLFLRKICDEERRNMKRSFLVYIFSADMEQAAVFQHLFLRDEILSEWMCCVHFSDFNSRSITSPDMILADFSDFSQETRESFSGMRKDYFSSVCFAFYESLRGEYWSWLKKNGVQNIYRKPFPLFSVLDSLYGFLLRSN
ncbi:MAG: hypothetical protein Q4C96_08130 [Planctomycetia bacterium]|nr:hypothetical protein [Planctomycetia bacterium]